MCTRDRKRKRKKYSVEHGKWFIVLARRQWRVGSFGSHSWRNSSFNNGVKGLKNTPRPGWRFAFVSSFFGSIILLPRVIDVCQPWKIYRVEISWINLLLNTWFVNHYLLFAQFNLTRYDTCKSACFYKPIEINLIRSYFIVIVTYRYVKLLLFFYSFILLFLNRISMEKLN